MRWLILATLGLLFTTMAPAEAQASPSLMRNITAEDLGFGTAQDLADSPMTNAIRMSGGDGHFNQATFVMQVTWGDSTEVEVACQGSGDGTNYGWIPRCTDTTPHACEHRSWEFLKTEWADGELLLNVPSNYRFLRCEWDDPGDGTGTIQGHAVLGRQ